MKELYAARKGQKATRPTSKRIKDLGLSKMGGALQGKVSFHFGMTHSEIDILRNKYGHNFSNGKLLRLFLNEHLLGITG